MAITAGLDYRLTDALIASFALGANRGHTEVSDNGTTVDGTGGTVSGYASWQALPDFYLDMLAGYGWLSFDNARYVTATGDFADSTRDGRPFYAFLQARPTNMT